jgi:general secretion pathway protein H
MRAERGLTLLELLVVLAILGLVSGLAATAYGGRAARQQERWTSELSLLLRAARQEALGTGRMVQVAIGDDAIAAQPSRRPLALRLGTAMHARWAAHSLDGQRSAPMFYPDGSATPGTLEVDMDGGRRRIEIDWLGGIHDVGTRP